MNAHDIELALRTRATYNESTECLDTDTRRRLRDLRLHALKSHAQPARARWLWPAGMATAAALALAVFLPHLPQAPSATNPAMHVAVVQHHTAPASTVASTVAENTNSGMAPAPSVESVDPDELGDLGFYGWLAKQQDTGKTGG